jgi:hypothetical protein
MPTAGNSIARRRDGTGVPRAMWHGKMAGGGGGGGGGDRVRELPSHVAVGADITRTQPATDAVHVEDVRACTPADEHPRVVGRGVDTAGLQFEAGLVQAVAADCAGVCVEYAPAVRYVTGWGGGGGLAEAALSTSIDGRVPMCVSIVSLFGCGRLGRRRALKNKPASRGGTSLQVPAPDAHDVPRFHDVLGTTVTLGHGLTRRFGLGLGLGHVNLLQLSQRRSVSARGQSPAHAAARTWARAGPRITRVSVSYDLARSIVSWRVLLEVHRTAS